MEVEVAPEKRRIPIRGALQLTAGVFMLWVAFYVLGQSLLLIPSEYHESRGSLLEQIEAMDARDRAEREREAESAGEDTSEQLDTESPPTGESDSDDQDVDPSPVGES